MTSILELTNLILNIIRLRPEESSMKPAGKTFVTNRIGDPRLAYRGPRLHLHHRARRGPSQAHRVAQRPQGAGRAAQEEGVSRMKIRSPNQCFDHREPRTLLQPSTQDGWCKAPCQPVSEPLRRVHRRENTRPRHIQLHHGACTFPARPRHRQVGTR